MSNIHQISKQLSGVSRGMLVLVVNIVVLLLRKQGWE